MCSNEILKWLTCSSYVTEYMITSSWCTDANCSPDNTLALAYERLLVIHHTKKHYSKLKQGTKYSDAIINAKNEVFRLFSDKYNWTRPGVAGWLNYIIFPHSL